MYENIHEMIDKFLKEYRTSDGDSWTSVPSGDIQQLHDVVHAIVDAKYDKDLDGDLPIEVHLVDRNVYCPFWFFKTKYPHKIETPEDLNEEMKLAMSNLKLAQTHMERLLVLLDFNIRENDKWLG